MSKLAILSFIVLSFVNIICAQRDIYINRIDQLKEIDIIYKTPDYQHPAMIIKTIHKNPKGDIELINTYNLDDHFIKSFKLNENAVSNNFSLEGRFIKQNPKLISKQLSDYILLDSLIIVLFSEKMDWSNVGGIDLVIFEDKGDNIYLNSVYPEAFFSNYYSDLKITHINQDTIKIGFETENEGDISGSYYYFVISSNSIEYFREERIHGHSNSLSFNANNPISGATTKAYQNTFYSNNDEIVKQVYYTSITADGKQIQGKGVSDSLTLYELEWNNVGSFIKKVKNDKTHINVGEKFKLRKGEFIAIEYNDKWYWIPTNEITLTLD